MPPSSEVTMEVLLPLISQHLSKLSTENEELKQQIAETD